MGGCLPTEEKMNFQHIKGKFQVLDTRGMDQNTVRTLWLLIAAVMGGTVWANITTGIAFSGYWKKMGASDLLYGVVIALPSLANGFQFLASYVLERTLKRKKMFLISGLIQRSVWLPFALVPLLVPMEQPALRLWAAAVLALVSAATAPFMNVSFYSICNDVVPIRIRGRYFATRSRIATMVGLLIGVLTGVLLDAFPGLTGYAFVFILASVFGVADVCLFFLMKLPEMQPAPGKTGVLRMLSTVIADKRYMRIVVFCTVWMFSVQISSPYFNVYMQNAMRLSNLQITLFSQVVSNGALVLAVTKWGGALDRFGSKPVIWVACALNALHTLLWSFIGGKNIYGVMFVSIVAGSSWCAYDIGAQNLFMGQAGRENQTMYTAVYFMFTQLLGCALGNAVGGFLLDNVFCRMEAWNFSMPGFSMTRYNFLFLFSGTLRFLSIFLLLPRIHEEGASSAREMLGSALAAFRRLAGSHLLKKP